MINGGFLLVFVDLMVFFVWCLAFFAGGAEREVQKSYWIEHSQDLTVEAMMLDSRAADLDKEERPEVRET